MLKKRKPILFLIIFPLLLVIILASSSYSSTAKAALAAPVATQTLGCVPVEDSLCVTVYDSGAMDIDRYDSGSWVGQIYISKAKGSRLQSSDGSYSFDDDTAFFDIAGIQGTPISNTTNNNTITTIWTAGNVAVTQHTTYNDGDDYILLEWELTNTSGSAITDMRFFHGEDTYLAGGDFGAGFWVPATNTIGVQKTVAGDLQRMMLQGITVPHAYQSNSFSSVIGNINASALTNAVDTDESTDNAYALEWRQATLNAGETWNITAYEKFKSGTVGSLLVIAPTSTDCMAGSSCDLTYTVQNDTASPVAATFSISGTLPWGQVITSPGISATIPGDSSIPVVVQVTVPGGTAGGTIGNFTLTANDGSTDSDDTAAVMAISPDALALTKTAEDLNGAPLYNGDTIRYTISITNENPISMTNVVVTDTLPAGVTYDSASITPDSTGPLVWNVGTLAANANWTVTIDVHVDGSANPIGGNYATVNSDQQSEDGVGPIFPDDGDGEVTPTPCTTPIVVTSTLSSGTGTLRQAIADVCEGGLITFDNDYTIDISAGSPITGELAIDKSMTIDGETNAVTVSGGNTTRVFNVTAGNITFDSLTIADGNVQTEDCGIYTNWCGGGIMIQNSGVAVTVTNSTLINNMADEHFSVGAGEIVYGSGSGIENYGVLTVNNSLVSSNTATYGGGISNNGVLTVNNSLVSSNTATYGGGIHNSFGTAMVSNSTFSDNIAHDGSTIGTGGGFQSGGDTANSVFTNVTFSGNQANGTADDGGGAIMLYHAGNITLIHTTLISNSTATSGGGISIASTGVITSSNSIIANSTNGGDCNGTVTSTGYNLDSDGTCGLAGTGDISNADPLLDALADNGGDTFTHALLPGSPAIDAGDCTSGPALDQRGIARPQDTTCDIGAYESRGFNFSFTSGSPQTTTISTAFANPLALTVSSSNGEPVDGGQVTFTAPASGASLNVTETVATISSGAVSQAVTANGTAGSYTVTADASGNLGSGIEYALTNEPDTQELTVSLDGTGGGSVLSNPAGIDCEGDCSETYDHGTVVTLTATTNLDSVFTGWSGAVATTANPLILTIDAAKSVTATFELRPINDDLVNAIVIDSLPFTDTNNINNHYGTLETAEASQSCAGADGSNSVWWAYTPATSGEFMINTNYSDFDTVLSVWTGAGHPLAEVDCNDDGGEGTRSALTIPMSGGITYYIRVNGYGWDSGDAWGTVQLAVSQIFYSTFLPVIMTPAVPGEPELVVEAINVTADAVEVVIKNEGTAAADDFWVDMYINPDTAPTGINQTWVTNGGEGLVWGVIDPLLAGESLTLTLSSIYYAPDESSFPSGIITVGSTVYAQVDAVGESWYGAVLEIDEDNNISDPLVTTEESVPTAVLGTSSSFLEKYMATRPESE